MASDDVTINIRSRGGRTAAADINRVSTSLTGVQRAARVAATGLRNFQRNTDLSATSMFILRRSLYATGAAFAGVGALSVKTGLQFNATMEQNQIAFTQLLGSSQAARKELDFLFRTARDTPFTSRQVTGASRQLLAYGFTVKRTNSLLKTLGDSAAGAGLGADAIDRMVLAIGQIKGKGTLQTEELRQLQELGIVQPDKLAKNLGVTVAQLNDAAQQGISSDKAIRALQKTLNDTFGGQSAKQARSFNGQMSTLHDNLAKTLGTITKPGFDSLRKTWLPQLNKTAEDVGRIWDRKDLSPTEKWNQAVAKARLDLNPLARKIGDGLKQAHLADRLSDAIDWAAPKIADAFARNAPRAAYAFVRAWINAGIWTKFLSAAWLLKKTGGFGEAGRIAGTRWGRNFIFGAVGAAAAYEAAKAAAKIIGGPVQVGSELANSNVAVESNKLVQRGRVLGKDPVTRRASTAWQRAHPGIDPFHATPATLARTGYPALIPGAPGVPRGYRPTVSDAGAKEMNIKLYIDGKQVAVSVNRHNADDAANGRKKPRGG